MQKLLARIDRFSVRFGVPYALIFLATLFTLANTAAKTIGSQDTVLVVPDPAVASPSAVVERDGANGWSLVPIADDARLNGQPLRTRAQLRSTMSMGQLADSIELGRGTYELRMDTAPPALSVLTIDITPAGDRATLVGSLRNRLVREAPVDPSFVGRIPDVVLPAASGVRPLHAVVRATAQGIEIEAQPGAIVAIDGRALDPGVPAPLLAGSMLALGMLELTVERDAAGGYLLRPTESARARLEQRLPAGSGRVVLSGLPTPGEVWLGDRVEDPVYAQIVAFAAARGLLFVDPQGDLRVDGFDLDGRPTPAAASRPAVDGRLLDQVFVLEDDAGAPRLAWRRCPRASSGDRCWVRATDRDALLLARSPRAGDPRVVMGLAPGLFARIDPSVQMSLVGRGSILANRPANPRVQVSCPERTATFILGGSVPDLVFDPADPKEGSPIGAAPRVQVRRGKTTFLMESKKDGVLASLGGTSPPVAIDAGQAFEVGPCTLERIDREGRVLAQTVNRAGSPRRDYPLGREAAHLVGYESPLQGIAAGLEADADGLLQAPSTGTLVDRVLGRDHGRDLETTIEPDAQAILHDVLVYGLAKWRGEGAVNAAGVVLDADGAILAAVSLPDFDPNDPTALPGLLAGEDSLPTLERALVDHALDARERPPGSIAKLVVGYQAQALRDLGLLIEHDHALLISGEGQPGSPRFFHCDGELETLGGKRLRDPVRCHDRHAHGMVTFDRFVEASCNCAAAQLAFLIASHAGPQTLYSAFETFGWNREIDPLGAAIPESAMGPRDLLLSARHTSPSEMPHEIDARDVDRVARVGFGQLVLPRHRLTMSALQGASLILQIARGEGISPHLVRGASGGGEPPIDRKAARAVLQAACRVVTGAEGTARRAFDGSPLRDRVCGKTGTAEQGKGRQLAGFTAVFPADAPKWAICIQIQGGSTLGSGAPALLARYALEALAGLPAS